jgi:hypothetical protein
MNNDEIIKECLEKLKYDWDTVAADFKPNEKDLLNYAIHLARSDQKQKDRMEFEKLLSELDRHIMLDTREEINTGQRIVGYLRAKLKEE